MVQRLQQPPCVGHRSAPRSRPGHEAEFARYKRGRLRELPLALGAPFTRVVVALEVQCREKEPGRHGVRIAEKRVGLERLASGVLRLTETTTTPIQIPHPLPRRR